MKRSETPLKHVVIRDLKRGAVKVKYNDRGSEIERRVTLANTMIPEKHMAETSPNNPLELDEVTAFDTKRLQWVKFKISELELYEPPLGFVWDRQSAAEEITTPTPSRGSKKGTRNRSTEGVQASEETQTDDRGAEAEGEGEPSKG